MFWKKLTLLDTIYQMTKAWGVAMPITISTPYKRIFPETEDNECLSSEKETISKA